MEYGAATDQEVYDFFFKQIGSPQNEPLQTLNMVNEAQKVLPTIKDNLLRTRLEGIISSNQNFIDNVFGEELSRKIPIRLHKI